MGRQKDKAWDYVTIIGGYASAGSKVWRCNFCLEEHSGSPMRIKLHLAQIKGRDITTCPSVPSDVAKEFKHELMHEEKENFPSSSVQNHVGFPRSPSHPSSSQRSTSPVQP